MPQKPAHIGRFTILSTLGIGGMGIVYLGKDPDIGRKVAIKVLHSVNDPATLDRFKNEARTIGELSHPNIVTLLEYGVENNQPFLVMEYLPGEPLEKWKNTAHTLFEHKKVLLGLCDALGFAHENGILHRDLKPGNVQILPGGHPKLLDFGIARSDDAGLTATGFFIGTPKYLAPELLTGDPHSVSSDCYSLALIAYTMLCGQNPFEAEQFEAVMTKKLTVVPTPLHQLNAAIPHTLSETISAYLQKNPGDRPQDLLPLKAAFEKLTSEKVLNRNIKPLGKHQTDAISGTTVLQVSTGGKTRTAGRWIGALVVLLAAAGTLFWWLNPDFLAPGDLPGKRTSTVLTGTEVPNDNFVAPSTSQADPDNQAVISHQGDTGSQQPESPLSGTKTAEQNGETQSPSSAQEKLAGPENSEPPESLAAETPQESSPAEQAQPEKKAQAPSGPSHITRSHRTVSANNKPTKTQSAHDRARAANREQTQPDQTILALDESEFQATGSNNAASHRRQTPATRLPSFATAGEDRPEIKPLTSTVLPRGKTSRLMLQLPGAQTLDDLRILRGRKPSRQITIVNQKALSKNRMLVNLYVEPNAVLGEYTLSGTLGKKKTRPVTLEVTL